MIAIPWELNVSGVCATLKTKKTVRKTPAKLKSEAVERMVGVSLVSAEFEGTPKVFEPKMWMLLQSGTSVEFIGLYTPSFSSDEEDNLPSVCVRRGVWSKGHQVDLFNTEFVSGDIGVINTLFFKKDSVENLIGQLQNIEGYVSNGLKIVDSLKEEKGKWESVRLFINADMLSLEIEYSPQVKNEKYLEAALTRLKEHLDKIGTNGAVPDKSSHRISYQESVLDQFSDTLPSRLD